MKQVALVAALLGACVPASDDNLDPRGAAGARFVPDAIAQGTPFTTSDGWTITFERIALVAQISAQSASDGSGGYVVWDGTQKAETWVSALPVGSCAVSVHLEGVYLGRDRGGGLDRAGLLAASKVSADIASLVLSTPDNESSTLGISTAYGRIQQGPAIVFAAHATKDGQTMRLALSLAAAFTFISDSARVVTLLVPQNDVLFAEYDVRPELVFASGTDESSIVFEPLAEADRRGNGDGTISADELHAFSLLSTGSAPNGCEDATGLLSIDCATLLDRIADNAQRIVVPIGTSR